MQYFNFRRLIEKYISEFTVTALTDGYYDESGDWVKVNKEEMTLTGAIINHKDIKIYRSDGTLTSKDKRLFMLEPIDEALQAAKVVYDGNKYSIEDCSENSKFTGVWAYTLKWISAFKDTAPEYDLTEEADKLNKRIDGKDWKPYSNDSNDYKLDDTSAELNKTIDGKGDNYGGVINE